MSGTTYKIKFRRRREQKTNYPKRLAYLKSEKPRMVFRKSNRYITLQLVEYIQGQDQTQINVSSKQLQTMGWMGNTNLATCYLLGYLFGKQAKQKGYTEAILDIGQNTPHHGGKAFSALKGALDAGLKIPHAEDALPKPERAQGNHIQEYAQKMDTEKIKKQFSQYLGKNIDPKNLTKVFEKVKTEIDQKNFTQNK
ncbi:MAG: 50S ribosomal protein L18 [Candidatus Diapherotrites archaeon]|nr:50S ribosomal protein L18 [Candidatus Diapherotrites archaeon]